MSEIVERDAKCANCKFLHAWQEEEERVYGTRTTGLLWWKKRVRVLEFHHPAQGGWECSRYPEWTDILDDWHYCGEFQPREAADVTD